MSGLGSTFTPLYERGANRYSPFTPLVATKLTFQGILKLDGSAGNVWPEKMIMVMNKFRKKLPLRKNVFLDVKNVREKR